MPYIEQEKRKLYDKNINDLADKWREEGFHPGHANYIITRLLLTYWEEETSYKTANHILGLFNAIPLEFYLRFIKDYEEMKRNLNGDI